MQTLPIELPPSERIGRFTVDQYLKMIDMGIFRDGAPYELLDGLLVLKDRSTRGEDIMSIGEPHSYVVAVLGALSGQLAQHDCFMRTQSAIQIPPLHAPEPDGAIIRGLLRPFKRPPLPADVCCVIEVSDSSLTTDRIDKAEKYAEAGIPQYVVVDLVHRIVEVRERPVAGKRKYATCRIVKTGQSVEFLMGDGTKLPVPVASLLP
ncbi:MAG TPA: Uma2 family endonuclease [Planctomycetota bacterium]|nr:Uma2 family endonuclease [Planctomycetota bacterium]